MRVNRNPSRRALLAGRRLPACAVLAGLALLGASAPASAQALTWTVVASPRPSIPFSTLSDVSCVSLASCTAVGHYSTKNGGDLSLIESWNGTHWSVVPSPDPSASSNDLNSVSCISSAFCMAVGRYGASGSAAMTLAESWNGTQWSVVPSPSPTTDSSLNSVTCTSATACMAVGFSLAPNGLHDNTLTESWNGTSWSVTSSASPGAEGSVLDGVSCSSAADCWAVGSYRTSSGNDRTLTEVWEGGNVGWTLISSPSPSAYPALNSVSCTSVDACTAVGVRSSDGQQDQTLVESWNGSIWKVAPSPDSDYSDALVGVSCASATSCTAVGSRRLSGQPARTLIESWDGTSWSLTSSPSPGAEDFLVGVSCTSTTACTAAGYYRPSSSRDNYAPLIESGAASA
jgi:hypothetical protein